ncbi:MAG: hypothetical protein KF718_26035 [Polyangiaceae bacterium]|nr:hypothetical protein [Polyangiaceae bacterium]
MRLVLRWCFGCALALGLLGGASVASGKPRAATKFDEALALFKLGAHAEAAQTFYEAHRLTPHADALYNAGLSWELAKQRAFAATAYETALQMKLSDAAASDARTRLAKLADVLGRVEVAAPEGSTIRSEPFVVRAASAVFYFEPGRRRIDVTLPGGDYAVRRVDVMPGETAVVLVESAGSQDDAPPTRRPTRETADETAASRGSTERALGWTAIGAAGALSIGAVALGITALRARDDYEASGNRDAAARERAERMRLWTNIAWGGAAAFAVTGGVLLIVGKDDSGGSVALRGSF